MLRATWTKPPIRTVLAAVALSRRAAAIASEAAMIARLFGAELHLVHAGPDTRKARRKLRMNLASTNLPVSTPTIIQSGRPDRVVCETAESIGADLIVAGVMRRDSTLAEHANSVAGRLVVSAPCHVLLIREPRTQPTPPRRILATVGFDQGSRDMLDWTLRWARQIGVEEFDVVHEYDPRAFYAQGEGEPEARPGASPRVLASQRRQELDRMLCGFDWTGLRRSQICLRSNSGFDALWYARLMGSDLMCMPVTPRRLSFWRRLIGHGLAVDLHALSCPVLFFKP